MTATKKSIASSVLELVVIVATALGLALVMLRPNVVIFGAYLDEWLLALAALVTVWSGVDYFVRFSSSLRGDT